MNTSNRKLSLRKLLALAVCLAASSPVASEESASPGVARGTGWNDVSSVRLDVEFPGNGYHADWVLHRCDCGDLLIESELNLPGEVEKGELLLVGQRAVLERGFKSEELETEMSWDAPALMMQLAAYLMQKSIPDGPASVSNRAVVSIREEHETISLDSGNAVGGFPAPWAVTTMVEPFQDTHRRFDLQFTFSVPGETKMAEMRLKGTGDFARADFPLSGDMSLDGWTLNWRNADDPARTAENVATLSELRALIASTPGGATAPRKQ
jgi:hypothetical protein